MFSLYHLQKKITYYTPRLLPALRLFLQNYARTRRLWRGKKKGHYAYTVVTPVHNGARYLDAYFRSLTGQILDFDSIFLILVDDGSTDASAAIIKSWQTRYPKNIRYLYQEHKGSASARNLGISLTDTQWITFAEPTDFLDVACFSHVDDILVRNTQNKNAIRMVVCDEIVYSEDELYVFRYRERVPQSLSFSKKGMKFRQKIREIPTPTTARSAFYNAFELKKKGVFFEQELHSKAEDLLFNIRYLQSITDGNIIFASLAKYYRRKEQNRSLPAGVSGATGCSKILALLETSCARLLAVSPPENAAGSVGPLVQSAMFTLLSGYVKSLYNAPLPKELNASETERFFHLLESCFQSVEPETVESVGALLEGFDFPCIVATLAYFKNREPSQQVVFVTTYDHRKKQLCLVYYCKEILSEQTRLSGIETQIVFSKSTLNRLGGRPCSLRRQIWVQLSSPDDLIEVVIAGKHAEVDVNGARCSSVTAAQAILPFGGSLASPILFPEKAPWIFMDRMDQADDNAEHLYRYVKNTMPDLPIYYAIQKTSPDWPRLKKEGFQLLEPDSRRFDSILRKAAVLLSSHFDLFQHAKILCGINALKKRYISLRHGVSEKDQSGWFNEIDLDMIVSSTTDEFNAIVNEGTSYNASKRNVRLTGIPRHDALVPYIKHHNNVIFIMPTWRRYIKISLRNYERKDWPEHFLKLKYGKMWSALFLSEELRTIQKKYAARIVLFPHADLRSYLFCLSLPDWITVAQPAQRSIQEFLKEAVVLITDYSSIAFEMAFLQKAVLYYQFDQEDFFSGHWERGYFDYARDGFGPVATDPQVLLRNLDAVLSQNGVPASVYSERMEKVFPFRDGRNCERVCEAVLDLNGRY